MGEWFEQEQQGAGLWPGASPECWADKPEEQQWPILCAWTSMSPAEITGNPPWWEKTEALRIWPVEEVNQPAQGQLLVPKMIPDISGGLGKLQAKRDMVMLERFLCESELWRVYNRKLCLFRPPCWRRLDDQEAEVEIRRVLSDYGLDDCLTSGDYRELRRSLLINPAIQGGKEPKPPADAINLLDGVLALNTGELRPHDPADGFFHSINVTSKEVMLSTEGPVFERFVENASGGDPAVRRQLLELVALLLTNRQIKAFFALLGDSHTGKSQFGRFLEELVGQENAETLRDIEDFADKWTTGKLKGKRLVTCLDLPEDALSAKAVGRIKQFVGDDSVKGEYKRGELFTFYDKPLLVCAGNHPIRVPNADREEAFWNRLVVVPFQNPVPESEMVQGLYNELLRETPYIIAQAITVWQDLSERNFKLTRAEIPEKYRPAEGNERWKAVQAFAEEHLERCPEAEILSRVIYEEFQRSTMATSMTSTDFARLFAQLTQRMGTEVIPIKRVAGTDQRGYRGLKLREPSA